MENPNYPFLKLTLDEKYPRLLITRRPENKTAEQNIYGAFLPVGMARRFFDLLARVFRLRPCELDIRGDFDAPCPEFYLRRCLAPCVERICDRRTYLETVEIVHLILSGQPELALRKFDLKIAELSDDLEFERAAEWRDKRSTIAETFGNAKWRIDVSAMNDVITVNVGDDSVEIHLTTLRRGKSVGSLNFQTQSERSAGEIVKNFIENFYRFYAPKLIYVPQDFPGRKSLEENLKLKFGRQTKIVAQNAHKLPPSVIKTSNLAPHSFKHRRNRAPTDKIKLLEELKEIFDLPVLPRRIECFDVAHLAGREIVASRVAAADGVRQPDDNLVWEFENLSETAALAAAVYERLRLLPDKKDVPDLLIVDGGKPQINAVKKTLSKFNLIVPNLIGAVKPPKSHEQIAYFLTADDTRIEFDRRSAAMNFLQALRDGAHDLANKTHRELHSLIQIFRNNDSAPQIKYLLVPTRFAERGGSAEDLSPIRSMTQAGEIILKTINKNPKQSDG